MAYRYPRLGVWPETYTQNDLLALSYVWGEELNPISLNAKNKLFGTFSSDDLKGESGDDFGSDLLVGGPNNDLLKGFRGADYLIGGEGDDEMMKVHVNVRV